LACLHTVRTGVAVPDEDDDWDEWVILDLSAPAMYLVETDPEPGEEEGEQWIVLHLPELMEVEQ
jgi:hypothetical protein